MTSGRDLTGGSNSPARDGESPYQSRPEPFFVVVRTDLPQQPVMATAMRTRPEAEAAKQTISNHWVSLGKQMTLEVVEVTTEEQEAIVAILREVLPAMGRVALANRSGRSAELGSGVQDRAGLQSATAAPLVPSEAH